ncbi:MAG: hypothetical protein ACREOO_07845 [bacterium]
MNKSRPYKLSPDWNEPGVRDIVEHYENQTDEEAAAEDQAFRRRAEALRRQNLTDDEIDRILTEEADKLSKYGESKRLRKHFMTLSLASHWLEKAKQLAAVHDYRDYRDWISQIVKERVQLEHRLYQRLQNDAKQNQKRKRRVSRARAYKQA